MAQINVISIHGLVVESRSPLKIHTCKSLCHYINKLNIVDCELIYGIPTFPLTAKTVLWNGHAKTLVNNTPYGE